MEERFTTSKGKKIARESDLKRVLTENWDRTRRDTFINWAITTRSELGEIGYSPVKVKRALRSVREATTYLPIGKRATTESRPKRWDAWEVTMKASKMGSTPPRETRITARSGHSA